MTYLNAALGSCEIDRFAANLIVSPTIGKHTQRNIHAVSYQLSKADLYLF